MATTKRFTPRRALLLTLRPALLLTLAVLTMESIGSIAATADAATPPPARSVAGTWEGTLASTIRFILHLDRSVSGACLGLDRLADGARQVEEDS